MPIADVPVAFQQPHKPYPRHNTGPGLEAAEHQALGRLEVPESWTYLPIYWTANYHAYAASRGDCVLRPVPAVQQWLDRALDPKLRYFTVVQCDDGIYEVLPANVVVFGAGGVGHLPIPLLCDEHPWPDPEADRPILASFMGQIECGGPEYADWEAPHSSWDKDGAGARLRREMRDSLAPKAGVVIKEGSGSTDDFRALMSLSKFALCPRGYGKTSFRLYEAMNLGAVPVYIYDEPWLPYEGELEWDDFSVQCSQYDLPDLHDGLVELAGMGWHSRAAEVARDHWRDYFTYEGVAKWMITALP